MATDFASRFAMLVDDGTEGLSGRAIGLAIGIHRNYGPGLLEKAYVRLYADALRNAGHDVECQPRLTLMDGGRRVKNAYRPDIIVDRRLVIEAKAVIAILPVHKQQLTTYMRLTKIRVGLLINFNVPVLRHGIRRVLLTDE
jgi:GxxExxY protein